MDGVALVRSVLLTFPAVTGLCGQRIYTGIWPQQVTLPAVLVQAVAKVEPGQLRGSSGRVFQRVQVDAKAVTRSEAINLAAAVEGNGAGSGLAFFHGSANGTPIAVIEPLSEFEDYTAGERGEFRVSRDYRVQLPR